MVGILIFFSFQGFLVNWEIEKQVWDYMFGKDVLKVSFSFSICCLKPLRALSAGVLCTLRVAG